MLAPSSLQFGAILILIGTDSDNTIKDPLENPQCGKYSSLNNNNNSTIQLVDTNQRGYPPNQVSFKNKTRYKPV